MAEKKAVRRKERRRMSRAEAQLSMRVESGTAEGAMVPIVTESRNISGSGVYCLSPHYLPPLSKVALTIVLPAVPGRSPSQRLLKCEGLVVRCQAGAGPARGRTYELACSFLGLEAAARERLEEYVVWRNLQAMRNASGAGARRRTAARRTAGTAAGRASATRASARGATSKGAAARKRRTVH